MPRLYCSSPLSADTLTLPAGAARHAQVLRLQPGAALTLFDGLGGEWAATVTQMGRSAVQVQVGAHAPVEREAPRAVHLALGMPANERMDWLVEKATELGAASIQPLTTAHGVLRLTGERADKRVAHWQAVAVAACEQCGRNRVPVLHAVRTFEHWLASCASASSPGAVPDLRLLLGFGPHAQPLPTLLRAASVEAPLTLLSGPEGGLAPAEVAAALDAGFTLATLGARVLRAETAPLAALMTAMSLAA